MSRRSKPRRGPLSKSDRATPKQSKIYKDRARKTPVNKTAALVARGKGGPMRRRGEVPCAHCGEPIKEKEMKRHLMVVHDLKNIVMNDGPRKRNGVVFRDRATHLEEKRKRTAEAPGDPWVVCNFCGRRMKKNSFPRHARRFHHGESPSYSE